MNSENREHESEEAARESRIEAAVKALQEGKPVLRKVEGGYDGSIEGQSGIRVTKEEYLEAQRRLESSKQ
ncbi:MAG: hypothetical protein KW802_04090 [Candidatus Doudnabacteria bacterium]|nr:hypothetical protein [Candidatus Doudnabacteria bacterium]